MNQKLLIVFSLLLSACGFTPQKVDLNHLIFNENPEVLLKSIVHEKIPRDGGLIDYRVKNTTDCLFEGTNMEEEVRITGAGGAITSYYAGTQLTATTKKVLKTLLAKYHQPTKKITDNGDTRAYYWITPEVYIRFMSGETFSPTLGRQNFSFIEMASMKSINAKLDPEINRLYMLVSETK
ncbi:hypothetical protein ABIB62_004093 [Mucilaginibacter sp. UYP25]|uniref:hypothetical protein n=1 Tax=unclassified Mucilaginibacter TaxID=2617802 RepID=UPI003396AA4C